MTDYLSFTVSGESPYTQKSRTFEVEIIDDSIFENDETLNIVFTSADLLGVSFANESINITGTALKMALVVAVPVILGMIIRKFADNFIGSKTSIIDKTTGILFLIVFIAIWVEE